uniref:HAT C-terminal dimerisation domain-containing protein n=1 Tax=Latimeria chalumnae TaxID=7897 RepID=H2ZVL6_LATCH
RDIPLSNNTLQRRTQELANFMQNEIAEKVTTSPFYSLCLDESLDITRNSKVIICVRYFDCDRHCFCEGVLCLATLCDRPTGKHIFESVKTRLDECRISFDNLCGLTADGAAAMQSARAGVLNCFQEICTQKLFMFHCFAHQEVLASKASMKTMDEVESIVKKSINAVNTSSINKGRFAALYKMDSERHKVLLNYNPVRWLSFNDNVQRLFELREEFISPELAQKLKDPAVHGCLLFLKEFLPRLASVNLELQKRQPTIFDSIEVIHTFRMTVTDIVQHLQEERDFTVFNELSQFLSCQDESVQYKVCLVVTEYLNILSEDLENHFSEGNFFRQYATFMTDPFNNTGSTSLAANILTIFNLKYLMVHMRNDARLKTYFTQPGVTVQEFWSNVFQFEDTYKPLAKVALLLLSLFPTTVLCERAFSALHFLKNKYRSRLTDRPKSKVMISELYPPQQESIHRKTNPTH